MEVTSLIIILMTVPVAFCMLTWLVATAYRLYVPEKAETAREIPIRFSRPLRSFDTVVAVDAREIKAGQRRELDRIGCRYAYSRGLSTGPPVDWIDELWRRRN